MLSRKWVNIAIVQLYRAEGLVITPTAQEILRRLKEEA